MVQNRSADVLHELWYQAGYRLVWRRDLVAVCQSVPSVQPRKLQPHLHRFHGTTFGGHPVSCAAAYAEVNELLDRDLAGNAKEVGAYFMDKLKNLPHVKEVRGMGLMIGVEFDDTIGAVDVKHGAFDRKLLITAIGSHVIRMVPPLIASREDCDKAYAILEETVNALSK